MQLGYLGRKILAGWNSAQSFGWQVACKAENKQSYDDCAKCNFCWLDFVGYIYRESVGPKKPLESFAQAG